MSWFSFLLAGFQVATYGRFWAAAEELRVCNGELSRPMKIRDMQNRKHARYFRRTRNGGMVNRLTLDSLNIVESDVPLDSAQHIRSGTHRTGNTAYVHRLQQVRNHLIVPDMGWEIFGNRVLPSMPPQNLTMTPVCSIVLH